MAAALDSGAITPQSTFWCPGREKIGKRTISCVVHSPFKGKHGTVRAQEIIEHSCNIGAAKVGLKMGQDRLKAYLERFGLNQKTGIELIGEVSRSLHEKDKWADIRTANVAFGQGIAVTPLQLLTAYAAVANGGKLVRPTILRQTHPAPGKQIIKPEVAKETLALLQDCVNMGTGKPAKIRGYEVGGKTGSAQKADGKFGYKTRKFIASFASVLPVNNPRIAILVTVDEPKGTHWGAVAAAPAVREVARQAVLELRIPPNNPADIVDGADRKTWR
jgi:cell division protein FtsI/penicillin-binding protein 2